MPASRASSIAVTAASCAAIGRARNGPRSGRSRSSEGSASSRALSWVNGSAPWISTGASGTAASRWLASFSVAARAADISRFAA
jgi:hypothetical protein